MVDSKVPLATDVDDREGFVVEISESERFRHATSASNLMLIDIICESIQQGCIAIKQRFTKQRRLFCEVVTQLSR